MSDITFKHHDPNVMLELWHVTKRFGGLTAVGDVSFKIKKGEIYALIGPNGAGKTTIFNLITGVYALTEGRVIFDGTVVGQGDAIIKDDMRETDVKPFRKQPYDIMSAPDLIMLDEPSLGLAPLLVNTIFDTIREIKAMGKTILLVEQNALKALSVADNAYVLEQGRITKSGPGKELLKDPAIAEAYLGKAAR